MNDLLYNITLNQRNEIEALAKNQIYTRSQEAQLATTITSPLIKVLLGPRRAGKSTLALQVLKNRSFAYFNFEDENLPTKFSGEELVKALEKAYGKTDFLFFDEIQNFDRWEQFLNRLQRLGKNIIATGSNSKLLSEELASSLTGRHLSIEVLPLSFAEIYDIKKNSASTDRTTLFDSYLHTGGFPEVILHNAPAAYLDTLRDSIILNDISKRYKVRNIKGLRDVLSLLLSHMGTRYSGHSLRRALSNSLSITTILKFASYAQSAYLIQELVPYSLKTKIRLKADRKAYLIDNGYYTKKQVRIFDDNSRLLENFVYIELIRRGYKPNLDLFYYQTKNQFEVDFLLRRGHQNEELIQVCHSLSSSTTVERELRALGKASSELAVKKLTVLTYNQEERQVVDGMEVNIIPAWRWALNEI